MLIKSHWFPAVFTISPNINPLHYMPFVPPSFSDLGKPANDLLGKDYPIGSAKLEVNTTTPNGIVSVLNQERELQIEL